MSLLLLGYFLFLSTLVLTSALVFRKRRIATNIEEYPAISIVKPLCGWSERLEENLTSFFTIAYEGEIELIFIAKDKNDPALHLARQLGQKFPDRKMRWTTTSDFTGWQPKTASMETGFRLATHERLVFADDDVRLETNVLTCMIATLESEKVGATYAQPFIASPSGLGGVFEACFMNYAMHIIHLHMERVGLDTLAGNTFAMKKSTLNALGGFKSIHTFIADDVMLGKALKKSGKLLCIAPHPVMVHSGAKSITSALEHQLRWLRIWRLSEGMKASLGFFYSSVFFVLPLILWLDLNLLWMMAFAYTEMMIAILIHRLVLKRTPDIRVIALTPLALLLVQVLVFVSFLSSTVRWRGNKYQLGKHGKIQSITPISTTPSR